MDNKLQCFNNFLQKLVGLELFHGIKSPDIQFYDFGVGYPVESESYNQLRRILSPYIIHATCNFEIVWVSNGKVDYFNHVTNKSLFDNYFVSKIKGLKIKKITLDNNNELCLFFDECFIKFSPFNDNIESWRIFSTVEKNSPHLVASATKIDFE